MTEDGKQGRHLIGRARAAIACSRELTRLVGRSLQRSLDLHIASEQRLAESQRKLSRPRRTRDASWRESRIRHQALPA
jgi:hypothetical protein